MSSVDGEICEESNDNENQVEEVEVNRRESNCYVDEYIQLFNAVKDYSTKLKRVSIGGYLRSCRFRSICWRVFLDCLPDNREEWIASITESRAAYEKIAAKYYVNPYQESTDKNIAQNNPLSQELTSPWNIYFQDNELKLTINQDVVRTFPEVDFFHSPEIQSSMSNILFHFAKENPKLGYKQGMHEVLAPILFVVHSDQQAYLHAKEIHLLDCAEEAVRNEIDTLLDPQYAEHDSYLMFCQIMDVIGLWYSQDSPLQKNEFVNSEPFKNSIDNGCTSFLSIKLKMIFEQILKRKAPDLYYFLESMQIAPQIFGIRWLRLIFGREYSMQDLLVIWDAIFADGMSFSLCDYIFVSMLIVIRRLIMTSNYSECMAFLMKYPNVPDVHYIINLSFHLRDPLNYCSPTDYSPHVMPIVTIPADNQPIHSGKGDEVNNDKQQQIPNSQSKQIQRATRPKTLLLIGKRSSENSETNSSERSHSLPETPANHSSDKSKNHSAKVTLTEMANMDGIGFTSESKINYCWNLIDEQVKVLQKCLSEETNLKNDDEIFVALAELKKVRDILKGTLKFPDESVA